METPLKKKNCVPIKYINDQEDSDIIDFENTTANDLQLQETNPKESVIQYIRQNKAVDSSTIDLCRKCISSIPKELRQISTIEVLFYFFSSLFLMRFYYNLTICATSNTIFEPKSSVP